MNKPLKVAWISAVILMCLSTFWQIFYGVISLLPLNQVFLVILSSIYLVVIYTLGILFYYGFVVLGNRFDVKLLTVMAWIGIIVSTLVTLFFLFGVYFIGTPEILVDLNESLSKLDSYQNSNITGPEVNSLNKEVNDAFKEIFIFVLILFLIISVVYGIYSILFGIGLLKLKDKVQYAKVTGILNIIAGATYIILIGYLLMIVAVILEIIMLYYASKEFEEGLQKKKIPNPKK